MSYIKSGSLLTLIASLLLGSSLSLIITPFLIEQFNLNFLSLDMPGMSNKLAYDKTFDLLDFFMAGALSFAFFVTHSLGMSLISGMNKQTKFFLPSLLLLIFAIAVFIQTHFIVFSSKQVLIMIAIFELIYAAFSFFLKDLSPSAIFEELKIPSGKLRFQNGVFIGFLLMLLTNNLTTIPALSLSFLVITPILTLAATGTKAKTFLENFPGFLILSSLFFPNNLLQVFILLGVLSVIAIILSKFKPGLILKNSVTSFLNPALIIFLIAYNPTFFIGNFDSVEEGFWLAWIQRLINGDLLYRDVAVYHPPLIPWTMYLFSKINGFNIYSERLFLHLLQVSGIIIYFFFARKVIKNTFFAFLSAFAYMAITATLVRNNVEIRVGMALLSLIFFFSYFELKKWWLLFLSGIISVISLFLSFEAGIAVLLTQFITLNIFSDTKFISKLRIKENLFLLIGVLSTTMVFVIYFFFTNSLGAFLEQTGFYAKAFSSGYFNAAIDRSVTHAFFHFHVFDEYLDSVTIFWEATKLLFYGFLIYGFFGFITGQKYTANTKSVLVTAFFGLILTRAALGRSDWYHLLFVSNIAIVLLFYSLYKLYETQKVWASIFILFFILVVVRPSVNNAFLEKVLFGYQTYGKTIGDYNSYYFDRGVGALIGKEIETKPTFELVEYIQTNSTKNDKIFVFPWNPEIYFYTDRVGATKFDTPYAFFSKTYQTQMIDQLKSTPPKFIVYSKDMNFGNLTTGTLQSVTDYINTNFTAVKAFGPYDLLVAKGTVENYPAQ